MGIFSKVFGGDKLELQDDSQETPDKKDKEGNEQEKEANENISPFLKDEEDKS
jgi:hypothetical protein